MKFSDFILDDSVCTQLESTDKKGVIREMVMKLAQADGISESDVESIIQALCKREELGTTGIGEGIAVPHTKHISVRGAIGAIGVSPDGIEFDSLDSEKVQLFFLLISPPDRPGEHLRALEHITLHVKNKEFSQALKNAKTSKAVLEILAKADAQLENGSESQAS